MQGDMVFYDICASENGMTASKKQGMDIQKDVDPG